MYNVNYNMITKLFFSCLLTLCMILSSVVEAASFKVTTNSLNLNLRASIGNGRIIAKMPTGSIVEGEDLGNGWARVTYNGVTGYATMQYLTKISTPPSPSLYNLTAAYPMDGVYTLTPGCATNMNLSIYNDGTANKAQAVIYNAGYRNSSKWKIQRIGNTEWYYIIDMNSGKSLDNEAGRGANGNMISLWPEQGVCQRWRFWQVRSGVYVIQAYTNDQFVLDVSGAATNANTIVQLWPYNTSPAQQWTLNKVATDLRPTTNNTFQQYTKTAQRQTKAYATSSLDSVYGNEWVDKGDVVTVLEETSNAYKVRYPVRNGYKERWVNKNIFTVEPVPNPINNNYETRSVTFYNGQVVDTFNGVEAKYTYGNCDTDGTYSCAALVKRYYSKVYGVNINNLLPNMTPKAGGRYLNKVSSPQVGDIVGMTNSSGVINGHWGIVKAVEGSKIVLFEQNLKKSTQRTITVNRRIDISKCRFYRL